MKGCLKQESDTCTCIEGIGRPFLSKLGYLQFVNPQIHEVVHYFLIKMPGV